MNSLAMMTFRLNICACLRTKKKSLRIEHNYSQLSPLQALESFCCDKIKQANKCMVEKVPMVVTHICRVSKRNTQLSQSEQCDARGGRMMRQVVHHLRWVLHAWTTQSNPSNLICMKICKIYVPKRSASFKSIMLYIYSSSFLTWSARSSVSCLQHSFLIVLRSSSRRHQRWCEQMDGGQAHCLHSATKSELKDLVNWKAA